MLTEHSPTLLTASVDCVDGMPSTLKWIDRDGENAIPNAATTMIVGVQQNSFSQGIPLKPASQGGTDCLMLLGMNSPTSVASLSPMFVELGSSSTDDSIIGEAAKLPLRVAITSACTPNGAIDNGAIDNDNPLDVKVNLVEDIPWPKFAAPVQAFPFQETESIGTALHSRGSCKPCLFVTSQFGCLDGSNCLFCHLRHVRSDKPRASKQKRERFKKFQEKVINQTNVPAGIAVSFANV